MGVQLCFTQGEGRRGSARALGPPVLLSSLHSLDWPWDTPGKGIPCG